MVEASFVTVHVASSVAEGEMITELLRAEGIPAHLSSVASAMLGAAPHLFQTKVLVPAQDAARAVELMQDLVRVSAEEDAARAATVDATAGPQSPTGGAEAVAADTALAPRRPRVAAAFAFLFPGGGHLYARSVPTAIVVEIGMGACLFLLLRGPARVFPQYAAFAILIALAVCDAWGAARLVRESNQGAPAPGPARALSRGVILLALAAGAGSTVAALASMPRWSRERRLAPFSVSSPRPVVASARGVCRPPWGQSAERWPGRLIPAQEDDD